jgi:hypothetical protein
MSSLVFSKDFEMYGPTHLPDLFKHVHVFGCKIYDTFNKINWLINVKKLIHLFIYQAIYLIFTQISRLWSQLLMYNSV